MNSQDELLIEEGRRKIKCFYAGILLASLCFTTQYVIFLGPDRLPIQATRFVLTLLLCRWIHSGSRFASWVSIALLGPSGFILIWNGFQQLEGNRIPALLILLIGVIYLMFCRAILFPGPVQGFLTRQRGDGSRQQP